MSVAIDYHSTTDHTEAPIVLLMIAQFLKSFSTAYTHCSLKLIFFYVQTSPNQLCEHATAK